MFPGESVGDLTALRGLGSTAFVSRESNYLVGVRNCVYVVWVFVSRRSIQY